MEHFGETHYWNGFPIICVPDDEESLKRKNNNVNDISWDHNTRVMLIHTSLPSKCHSVTPPTAPSYVPIPISTDWLLNILQNFHKENDLFPHLSLDYKNFHRPPTSCPPWTFAHYAVWSSCIRPPYIRSSLKAGIFCARNPHCHTWGSVQWTSVEWLKI